MDFSPESVPHHLTLGIDSAKEEISKTQNTIKQLHVELVCLANLRNGGLHWTGKSYPTTRQQEGLVVVPNLMTHFMKLDDVGKVMVLGCHDLSIYNDRARKIGDWRRNLKRRFREMATKEHPAIVLHHPHTTDCISTWSLAWHTLNKELSIVDEYREPIIVDKYASAGRWPHAGGYHPYVRGKKRGEQHCTLNDVLHKTKRGDAIDFIVYTLED